MRKQARRSASRIEMLNQSMCIAHHSYIARKNRHESQTQGMDDFIHILYHCTIYDNPFEPNTTRLKDSEVKAQHEYIDYYPNNRRSRGQG